MINEITCFDCCYYSPGEYGCPSYYHDQQIGEFDESAEGICRRHTPRHGETITQHNGDEFTCFAEWPKVMASDWCGEFKPRTKENTDILAGK